MTEVIDRARRLGLLAPEWISALLLLAVAIVFGGSSRASFGNLLVQLTAVALLTGLLVRRRVGWPQGMAAAGSWLMVAAAVLPLLYSVPVPPWLWAGLAGRDLALRSYALADIALPWHGIGLRDGIGFATALHLLAPTVMFLAVVQLTAVQRWALLYGFFGLALIAILVGFAQVPGGATHVLHFYDTSSIDGALGFFPNRNHMATLMLCTLPLAAAGAMIWLRMRGDAARLLGIAGAVLFALAIVALVATSARAGLVLALPVLIGCALLARITRGRGARGGAARGGTAREMRPLLIWGAILLAAALVVAGLTSSSLGNRLATRVQTQGIVDADRIEFARLTLIAIPRYLPFGSGPQTFRAIYTMIEPVDEMRPFYINHTHDDYLEILLEYGVPGGLLLLAGLAWLGCASLRAWLDVDAVDRAIRCAATIGIVAVLLHSTFDYPVRTTTIAVLLAMLAALTLASVPGPAVASVRAKRVRYRQRI